MGEIWRDIEGYEGLYQVSNLGRVKSLDRVTEFKDGRSRKFNGKILKGAYSHNGYLSVNLNKNGGKNHRVNRLVAIEFIENPNNHPEVNHINEIKTDNRVENLEWVTSKYNINYGDGIRKRAMHSMKAVAQLTDDGDIISIYTSITSVKDCGFSPRQVGKVVRGERMRSGGYKWKFL